METLNLIRNLNEKNYDAVHASGMQLSEMSAVLERFLSRAEYLNNPGDKNIAEQAIQTLKEYAEYEKMRIEDEQQQEEDEEDYSDLPACCEVCDGCFCRLGDGSFYHCPLGFLPGSVGEQQRKLAKYAIE